MQHQYTVGERIMGVAIEVLTGLEDQRRQAPSIRASSATNHRCTKQNAGVYCYQTPGPTQMDQPLEWGCGPRMEVRHESPD